MFFSLEYLHAQLNQAMHINIKVFLLTQLVGFGPKTEPVYIWEDSPYKWEESLHK